MSIPDWNWFEWLFWVFNLILSVVVTLQSAMKRNVNGVMLLATPGGWLYVWQALGVVLVFGMGRSPLHLIWWFVAGMILLPAIARPLYKSGKLKL